MIFFEPIEYHGIRQIKNQNHVADKAGKLFFENFHLAVVRLREVIHTPQFRVEDNRFVREGCVNIQ
jgi:hypothetical protein